MNRIVYFIGAGLTKSLESPGWPVPMMWDFVSTAAHYLDDDVVLTTMVDLERGDLYEWKHAEAAKLAGQAFPPDRSSFREALRNRPAESIEDLLERSLKPSGNFAAEGAHDRFRYAINRLFCLVGWNLTWPPLEGFLQRQIGLPDTEHTFVSLNYDLVLDRAVQRLSPDWTPGTGYGVEIPFYVTDDLPPIERQNGPLDYVRAAPFGKVPASSIRLLKPHGSLNWLLRYKIPYENARGGLRFLDGPLAVPISPVGEVRYWPSTHNFQPIAFPGDLPREIGICILAPSSAKRSDLSFFRQCREMESKAITDADEVVVIGWSVPETDLDQAGLIKAAIASRKGSLKRMTVVNRSAPVSYFHRLAKLFGVDAPSMRIHNSGFLDFVTTLSN